LALIKNILNMAYKVKQMKQTLKKMKLI